jgi:hypothetical protein
VTYTEAANEPPTADAGDDQELLDLDDDGFETVMLDGSGSADSDGSIVSYVWTEDAVEIATGMAPQVSLAVGTHIITLTVTDDGGATAEDTVVVTVEALELITVQYQVWASQDDTYCDSSGNYPTAGTMNWVYSNAARRAFVRWQLTLPPEAPIVSATVRVKASSTSANTTTGQMQMVDADSCPSLADSNPFAWVVTGPAVNWDVPPLTIGTWYDSPDVSDIVQAFVNRPGYEPGNYLGLRSSRVSGSTLKSAYQWDNGSHVNGAILEVVYLGAAIDNDSPVADAGPDQIVTDSDSSNYEIVTLDGSASSDADGAILSYVWKEGAAQIATGVMAQVNLAVGTHAITLTVTDNYGATDEATVIITVNPAGGPAQLYPETAAGFYDGPVSTIYTPGNAPDTPALEELQLATSVTQYGVTWTFSAPARVGQFITGDWYVVGPVTVVDIDPKPLYGQEVLDAGWTLINENAVKEDNYPNRWARNGSMLNPGTGPSYGYDSRIASGFYSSNLFRTFPVAMVPGDALVSTISTPDPINYRGYGQPVQTAPVLTCLSAPVPADAFRPSYCDRGSTIFLARNLHRELLYTLPKPAAAPANLSQHARIMQRPWLDLGAWGFGHPQDHMPRYGQWITHTASLMPLLLQMDYTPEQKEPLLVHYVQYGIDLWGIVRTGFAGWEGHGGFGQGRKWTLVFSGMLLGDAGMRSPNTGYPNCKFGEDRQTSYGNCWTGASTVFISHRAWLDTSFELTDPQVLLASYPGVFWVAVPPTYPYNYKASEGYRRCCTSVEWAGQALTARLMRAEGYWNHGAFFDYVDRWMTEDNQATAAYLKQAVLDNPYEDYSWTTDFWLSQQRIGGYQRPIVEHMWNTYRNNLPAPLP